MEMGKLMKNAGVGLMIIGLIFMVLVFMKSDNINYVMGGLLIVSIGSLLNAYGNKQIPKTKSIQPTKMMWVEYKSILIFRSQRLHNARHDLGEVTPARDMTNNVE